MCGRTACTLHPDELSRASCYKDRRGQRRQPTWRDGDSEKYKPSYNKSPQSMSPVLLSRRHFDRTAPLDECVLAAMRWGLIPAWFKKDDPSEMQYSTSNCRSESLMEKKSYKDPLVKGQRCVILADGFYEWRKQEKGKQPFFIYFPQSQGETEQQVEKAKHRENLETVCTQKGSLTDLAGEEKSTVLWTGWRLLTIAGLFDCWRPTSGGDPLYSYSVITVDASPNLQGIHERMPAILDGEEEVRKWLDFGDVKYVDALKLLKPQNILAFHPVSTIVNNSRNDSPECLQPVDPQTKKEPKPTASSKIMQNWLKKSTPSKRKEEDTHELQGEKQIKQEDLPKSAGYLEQWLQGANKKPRIN